MIKQAVLALVIAVATPGTSSASEVGAALSRCLTEGISAGHLLVSIPPDPSRPDTNAVIMCDGTAATTLFEKMSLVAEQSPGVEGTSRRAGKGVQCIRLSKSGDTSCFVTIETNAAFVEAISQ